MSNKYLKIENNGELDIRLLSLVGGTTKDQDASKIGQFGSGLKYAVAYLSRENIPFVVFINGKKIKFGTEQETIAGTEFDIITINGEQTSLTTKMGQQDWKPWMILREIWANALDEGGASRTVVDAEQINSDSKGKTVFYIRMTPEIAEVYNGWSNYFINDKVPMYETGVYKFYPEIGPLRIYKHGILIHESEVYHSIFNYDILNAGLNELRELRGSVDYAIAYALGEIQDEKTIEYLLESIKEYDEESKDKKFIEGEVDIRYWAGDFKDIWKKVLGNSKIIDHDTKQKLKGKNPNMDLTNLLVLPRMLYLGLSKTFEGVSAVRVTKTLGEFYEIHDEELKLLLKQGVTILEECKYFMHPELTYIFGEFGDKDIFAKVNIDKKEVLISQKCKDKSLFDFVSMLVEENEHFQTGYHDETRQFQQHFIDLYVKTLLEKNEVKL